MKVYDYLVIIRKTKDRNYYDSIWGVVIFNKII